MEHMSTARTTSNGIATEQDARQIHEEPSTRSTYRIDPAASRVEFTIHKRLLFVMPMTVIGRFAEVHGMIGLDERDPATARAEVTIGAASLSTETGKQSRLQAMQAAKRDAHLRKADFFDVGRYPNLTFRSRGVETIDRAEGHYQVTGDLTVRGVTREVALDAHYTPASGEGSVGRIRLTLTAPLNRRDFGMVWNRPYMNVADDLVARIEVEATRV
jgi:polyisoprenoid-binding protein YceI